MAEIEGKDKERPEWGSSGWRPGQPLPWAKFYRDWWGTNPDVRRLTPDQRGRLLDVYIVTHATKTPGVMDEDDVRGWAGYSPEEWKRHRDVFTRLFNTTRRRGKWLQEEWIEIARASQTVARRNFERARKGGETRARNAKGDKGDASSSTAQAPAQAQLGLDQRFRGLDGKTERHSVPDVAERDAGSAGHSPVASGGTVAVPALLERALRAGSADGTDGLDPQSRGAA